MWTRKLPCVLGKRRIQVGDATPGSRPDQGQEVGAEASAAPAGGIGRRQLGDRQVEGLAFDELASDAEVVERDEVSAAFGQAATHRQAS